MGTRRQAHHRPPRRRARLGAGTQRWVVERTFAWLHNFRRLRIRYERDGELHLAFMQLGCAVICQRMLRWPDELPSSVEARRPY